MLVGELIGDITTIEIKGDICRDLEYISLNSKETDEKTAFIAIKGFITDGHKYIENALDNNCKVIFHQDILSEYKKGITYIRMKDTRTALADLSSRLFCKPSNELNVVGITGTNGKTTTTYMSSHYDYYVVKAPSGDPATETDWQVVATQNVPGGVTNTYYASSLQTGYAGY